jgi:hypothetical protein
MNPLKVFNKLLSFYFWKKYIYIKKEEVTMEEKFTRNGLPITNWNKKKT